VPQEFTMFGKRLKKYAVLIYVGIVILLSLFAYAIMAAHAPADGIIVVKNADSVGLYTYVCNQKDIDYSVTTTIDTNNDRWDAIILYGVGNTNPIYNKIRQGLKKDAPNSEAYDCGTDFNCPEYLKALGQ
jgi:hypothetical protein